MSAPTASNTEIQRGVWIGIFLLGLLLLAGFAWSQQQASPMMWFLLSGVWSGVCGIGFTVQKWWADNPRRR